MEYVRRIVSTLFPQSDSRTIKLGFMSTLVRTALCSVALIACLLCGPGLVRAQQTKDKWHRVYTGEESVIEINSSSLRLQPDNVLRVQFRTTLSHAETLEGTSGTKYKTRLETIDFKVTGRYRLTEITFLDRGGKELQSYSTSELEDWKILKSGGVTERLFNAARALPPFGTWKVMAYRSADGAKPQELEDLIGGRVNLQFHRAEVGADFCTSPAFEDQRSSNEELSRELGIELKSFGVQAESVEAIKIKCEGIGWQPPQSLLIKVRDGEMLMLWEGVFLVLKR